MHARDLGGVLLEHPKRLRKLANLILPARVWHLEVAVAGCQALGQRSDVRKWTRDAAADHCRTSQHHRDCGRADKYKGKGYLIEYSGNVVEVYPGPDDPVPRLETFDEGDLRHRLLEPRLWP